MDFLNQPLILTSLRLAHIIFGMLWLGLGVVGVWVVHPLADRLGERGNFLLRDFYAYSNYNKIFPLAAIVTTVAGLVMWPARVDGMDFVAFGATGDIVMLIGSVFGLLAFGHGAGATGRFTAAYAKAVRANDENGENTDELDALRDKVFTHANISAILTLIAAVAMSSARYL
ncbi:MAG: hypothetical protein ACFE0Q_08195 [Anaerolineae bacterium]